MFEGLPHAFTTLFVIIDPVGMLPVFLALTAGMAGPRRRRAALTGPALAGLVLLLFALTGDPLLDLLGIGLPAFRIAGGLMLLWIAWEMVFERRRDRRSKTVETAAEEDVAVFPLAIPLLSGPGAITSIMLLMAERQGDPAAQAMVLLVLAAVLSLCVLMFLLAEPLERAMGPTLTGVVSRLLGILLAALAVQYVLDGIGNAFQVGVGAA